MQESKRVRARKNTRTVVIALRGSQKRVDWGSLGTDKKGKVSTGTEERWGDIGALSRRGSIISAKMGKKT